MLFGDLFVALILVCVFISQLVFIRRNLIVLCVVGDASLCIIRILATVAHSCMFVYVVCKFNIYIYIYIYILACLLAVSFIQ